VGVSLGAAAGLCSSRSLQFDHDDASRISSGTQSIYCFYTPYRRVGKEVEANGARHFSPFVRWLEQQSVDNNHSWVQDDNQTLTPTAKFETRESERAHEGRSTALIGLLRPIFLTVGVGIFTLHWSRTCEDGNIFICKGTLY
jgi:hypothetical protein